MRVRRVVSLLAAALVIGCGGGTANPPSQLGALSGSVQVNFWHALSGTLQTELQALTDRFNSSQSTVHVTLTAKGAYTDLNKAVLTGIAANQSPTVLYYNQDMFAAKGISAPPATWDEFFSDAAKLADPSKGVTGIEGPSLDTFLSMLYEYGGSSTTTL